MKRLERVSLALLMALILVACVEAPPASATTIAPSGAAFTLTSTNSSWTVHGYSSFNCTNSTISGTVPSGTATTITIPVTLAYSGCSVFGVYGYAFTVPASCQAGGASATKLKVTYNQATAPQAGVSLTVPAGCTITMNAPLITCTMTISGEQTVGAAGGIAWTNGGSVVASSATLSAALLPSITSHAGGGFGCPSAGAHTATLGGTYRVTTPATAPGVTVTP
jgi:hypothetical protein